MNYPKFIVSYQVEEPISIQRVDVVSRGLMLYSALPFLLDFFFKIFKEYIHVYLSLYCFTYYCNAIFVIYSASMKNYRYLKFNILRNIKYILIVFCLFVVVVFFVFFFGS